MLNTETEKFNSRVGMKTIRTAAELRDTWINAHTQKDERQMKIGPKAQNIYGL